MAAAIAADGDTVVGLDERDVRALTECMAVLSEGGDNLHRRRPERQYLHRRRSQGAVYL